MNNPRPKRQEATKDSPKKDDYGQPRFRLDVNFSVTSNPNLKVRPQETGMCRLALRVMLLDFLRSKQEVLLQHGIEGFITDSSSMNSHD